MSSSKRTQEFSRRIQCPKKHSFLKPYTSDSQKKTKEREKKREAFCPVKRDKIQQTRTRTTRKTLCLVFALNQTKVLPRWILEEQQQPRRWGTPCVVVVVRRAAAAERRRRRRRRQKKIEEEDPPCFVLGATAPFWGRLF